VIATTQDYRRVTGDLQSYDGDVTTALSDAQDEFLRRTGRIVELGTYTETLPIYQDGRVYPAATPVTSVLDPADAGFDDISIGVSAPGDLVTAGAYAWPGGYGYGGYAYGSYLGGYQPVPSDVLVGVDRRPPPPRREVTYTGGFAPAPPDVVRCVCEMAYYGTHPNLTSGVPAGATSVSLGDQSVTGSFVASTQFPASVTSVIAAYTRADP
jgi:hypothetical protein